MSEVVALRHRDQDGVRFAVSDSLVSLAVGAVFTNGIERVEEVVVTDNPAAVSPRALLIIGESDLAAARALDLIRANKLGSACPRDLLQSLPELVRALGAGCVAVPEEMIARARRAPALSDELFEVLTLLRLGYSNPQIANRMHCSLATAKRRIHELTVVFDANSRLELVTKTRAL